jgi:hypothetical protein
MLEGGGEGSDTSDYDLLELLHRMDDDDRMAALQSMPDAEVERVVDLIPLWRAVREMSAEESSGCWRVWTND